MPHSNVLRLAVSFKLDREVWTGDLIAGKGAALAQGLAVLSKAQYKGLSYF
jgi:hypothetical protein